tara:strand:+ start:131 stop:478 length:348 start_codon:yes stop_codon:yes gene_type:complete
MTFTTAAAINSTVTIDSDSFPAVTSLERSQELDRIDVTGFGSTSRAIIAGLKAPIEYSIRTYSDPAGVAVGASLAYSIQFAGGSSETGTGLITSFGSSADLEGATVHEITLVKTS